MNPQTLQLGKKTYSLQSLPQIGQPSTFDERTIDFCHRWLSGQLEFEIQTSGSTGQPKKILIERESMIASANGTIHALNLQPNQTSLICLDTAYIAGLMMLVRSLEIGMNIIAVEPCANPFKGIDTNTKIDFIALVPYQIKAILQSPQKFYLNQLGTVLIGGAPLDQSTKLALQSFKSLFFETYGMTETISHVALKQLNGLGKSSFFTTLPGVSIRQDERGCLCIQTSYLESELVTNDIVEMVDVNKFIWLGRWDNVINTGGLKVFPETIEAKVEATFAQLNITNLFFIAGLSDQRWGQAVTLLIEGELSSQEKERLRGNLKTALYKFEIPQSIVYLPLFKRTDSGKINRVNTLSLLDETQQ
ncbi:MAG: AMP-binding protein [Cyclobacteriaceae bacterium]|nr:AMP-binding protein [Cyclobacteriaceae bacterium]